MKTQFEKYDSLREEWIKLQGESQKAGETFQKVKLKHEDKKATVTIKDKPTAADKKSLTNLENQVKEAKKNWDNAVKKVDAQKKKVDTAYKALQEAAKKEGSKKKSETLDENQKKRQQVILQDNIMHLTRHLGSLQRVRERNGQEQIKVEEKIDTHKQALKSPRIKDGKNPPVKERLEIELERLKTIKESLIEAAGHASERVEECLEKIETSSKDLEKLTGIKVPSVKDMVEKGARIGLNTLERQDFENMGIIFEETETGIQAINGTKVVTGNTEHDVISYLQSSIAI